MIEFIDNRRAVDDPIPLSQLTEAKSNIADACVGGLICRRQHCLAGIKKH